MISTPLRKCPVSFPINLFSKKQKKQRGTNVTDVHFSSFQDGERLHAGKFYLFIMAELLMFKLVATAKVVKAILYCLGRVLHQVKLEKIQERKI